MRSPAFGCWRRLLGAAAATSVLLAGLVPAAHAAPTSADGAPDSHAEMDKTGNHPMGSQIRRHEGTSVTPIDTPEVGTQAAVYGIDVSSYQGNVDWAYHWSQGKRFAYVKATEGTGYTNPYFGQQYNGSYNVGMIRGAYHFALPDRSSGAAQATFFSDHGGGWSGDGRTLPGALDMEYNPYGATCYGKTQSAMAAWIRDFSNTYKTRWNKYPAIYTSTSWWNQCVGASFASTNPLWVARYASTVGTLPYNWTYYTFWQYSSTPLDQNVFNGSLTQLQILALYHD